jgi:hypothetical protein
LEEVARALGEQPSASTPPSEAENIGLKRIDLKRGGPFS